MQVYFSATITDDKEQKQRYARILSVLKSWDVEVYEYGSHRKELREIEKQSKGTVRKVFLELEKYIREADAYIAEVSYPSIGIGYEIYHAITLRKPVLVLLHKDAAFQPLATLEGNESKFITYVRDSLRDIESSLNNFLKKARAMKLNARFNCMLSKEHLEYLGRVSREKGLSNSAYVRRLIEEDMGEGNSKFQNPNSK